MLFDFKKDKEKTPVYFGQDIKLCGYDCKIVDINIEYAKSFVLNAIINRIGTDISVLQPFTNIDKLIYLIKRPNLNQTWQEFMFDLAARYELDNTVYIRAVLNDDGKTVNNLTVIPKKDVIIEQYDADGNITKYILSYKDGSSKYYDINTRYDNEPSNRIWKLSGFNSLSRYECDLPPSNYKSVCLSLDYIHLANLYNNVYLQRGAKPSFAIMVNSIDGYDSKLTDAERKELKESFINNYTGFENAGEPIVLEGGLELKQIDSNIDTLNFDEGFESAITFCCMVAQVNPVVIGYAKNGSSQYNVDKDIRSFYYNSKVIPLAKLLYGFLERNLVYRYTNRKEAFFTFNESLIPTIMKERFEVANIAGEIGAMTINEIRSLLSLPKVEGNADEVYTTAGRMPIDYVTVNAKERTVQEVNNNE